MGTVPTCLWRLRPDLFAAVARHLGRPDDSYANGLQAWLRPDGPAGMPIEWRLHPRPSFVRPGEIRAHDLFPAVAGALAAGEPPPVDPTTTWSGLEAAPAYGDEIDEADLVTRLTEVLGRPPEASGPVDREEVGLEWERSGGRLDVVDRLAGLLGAPPA